MTSQTTNGSTGFTCDSCPMSFEDDEAGSFHDAWASARRAGWHAEKVQDGQWEHTCPDCWRKQ